jgi:TolA-binding protein
VYTDPRVVRVITEKFVPVRVHVKDQHDDFKRLGEKYNAQWTPTILILDPAGQQRHRIEGFLPADDFLAQLALGAAHAAFARGDFAAAEKHFRTVLDQFPQSEMAPEAQYWAGVSRYKATGDPAALNETARAFGERYTNTTWAKKASVWAG